jgi:hypothetical protein
MNAREDPWAYRIGQEYRVRGRPKWDIKSGSESCEYTQVTGIYCIGNPSLSQAECSDILARCRKLGC